MYNYLKFFTGFLSVVLFSFTTVSASAEPWPTTRFEVVLVSPQSVIDPPTAGKEPDTSDVVLDFLNDSGFLDIDDPWLLPDRLNNNLPTFEINPNVKLGLELILEESAKLYETWGFSPPNLEPIVDTSRGKAYRVYLIRSKGLQSEAIYTGQCNSDIGANLVFNAEHMLSNLDTVASQNRNPQILPKYLFYAVEAATRFYDCEDVAGKTDVSLPTNALHRRGAWITDGLAEAVSWDVFRAIIDDYKPPSINLFRSLGSRDYQSPLPVPYSDSMSFASVRRAVGTSSFWRFLAQLAENGAPSPRQLPVNYSYAAEMLGNRLPGADCIDVNSACRGEMGWVDEQLHTIFDRPLRDLYSLFLQTHIDLPKVRVDVDTAQWIRELGFECNTIDMSKREMWDEQGAYTNREILNLREFATKCFQVFRTGPYELGANTWGNSPNIKTGDLTLTQSDHTKLIDENYEVIPPQDSISGSKHTSRQSIYALDLVGPETLILFSNIAGNPEKTSRIDAMQVTFYHYEEYFRWNAQRASQPTKVLSAIPLEFDKIDRNYVLAARTEIQEKRGFEDPCSLRFWFRNTKTGDGFQLEIDHEGPILPGVYDVIATHRESADGPEDHPNKFKADFGIGKYSELSQGIGHGYAAVTGTVQLDVAAPQKIVGSVTVLGDRWPDGEWTDDGYLDYPAESNRMAVTAEFSVNPQAVAGLPIEKCFHPDPSQRVLSQTIQAVE